MEVMGIDIGGSGIKGAVVDTTTGELISERFRLETPLPATPDAVVATVAEVVAHLNRPGLPIGVGLPAVVKNGVAHTAANIDGRMDRNQRGNGDPTSDERAFGACCQRCRCGRTGGDAFWGR